MLGSSLRVLDAACAVAAAVATAANAQGSWSKKAPMAAALNEVALAAVGGKIHVIGGSVLGVAGPYHQEYDIAKDTWRAARDVCRRASTTSASPCLNGKVYTVGGFVASVHRDGQNAAYEYDPAQRHLAHPAADEGRPRLGRRRRARRQDLRRRRAQSGRPGGRHPRGVRSRDQCLEGARAAAAARDHTATVAVDGKLHVIGGRTGGSTEKTDQHDIYDPAKNTWTSGPPLPTPRSGLAATLYKDMILVIGGELPPNTFAQNEGYNPKTKSWQALAPMPAGRHGTGAAASGGNVYVAAGSLKPRLRRRHQRADRIYLAVTTFTRRRCWIEPADWRRATNIEWGAFCATQYHLRAGCAGLACARRHRSTFVMST